MTTPAPQPAPVYGPWHLNRILLVVVATALFVIGAFAAGGHPLADVSVLPWWGGAFAAWVLSGAVP